MALVLCTGAHATLTRTRHLILENAGHAVVSALDEKQIHEACRKHKFEVAVIGQSSSTRAKQEWSTLIRLLCPAIKILEVYTPATGRALKDADDWLESPALPDELAGRVTTLAGKGKERATG
jgi:hypothetical protein